MRVIALLTILFISGCALNTQYQAQGFSGGYVDTQLNENTWRVVVNGNGFTKSNTVGDYALLRASELTLDNGYRYFIVGSSSQDKESNMVKWGGNSSRTTGQINNNGTFSSNTYNTSPTYSNVTKYENEIIFMMINEGEQGDMFAYDAQLIFDSLSAKYIK